MQIHMHNPTASHTHTVILLHGRGSGAQEFAEEFFQSKASDDRDLRDIFPDIKWVFLGAPMLWSARFKEDMSQWFDMWRTEGPHERQSEGDEGERQLDEAAASIVQVVEDEAGIIGGEHVSLGGISQGFATAIRAVLLKPELRLAGMIGLCSWLPRPSHTDAVMSRLPVFLCHSTDDPVIGVGHGSELRDGLMCMGFEVEWHEYEDGGHWINETKGVDDLVGFLRRCLRAGEA